MENLLKSMGGSANTREIFEKTWEIFKRTWEFFEKKSEFFGKIWEIFGKEEESWYAGEREKRENQGMCSNG